MNRTDYEWTDCGSFAFLLFVFFPLVAAYIAVRCAVEAVRERRAG